MEALEDVFLISSLNNPIPSEVGNRGAIARCQSVTKFARFRRSRNDGMGRVFEQGTEPETEQYLRIQSFKQSTRAKNVYRA